MNICLSIDHLRILRDAAIRELDCLGSDDNLDEWLLQSAVVLLTFPEVGDRIYVRALD